jgi:hypothetical protein
MRYAVICSHITIFFCFSALRRVPATCLVSQCPPKMPQTGPSTRNWDRNFKQRLQAESMEHWQRNKSFQTFFNASGDQRAQNLNVITERISLARLPTVFHRPIPPIRQFGAYSALIINTVFITVFNFNWFWLYFAMACDQFCDGRIDGREQKVRLSLISVDRGLLQHIS